MSQTPAEMRQPVFRLAYQEHQSRLTTFFRFITAIPSLLLLGLWGFAVFFTVIVAWFAVLFTGRYPQALYDFHASFARYATYTYAYADLATDKWPGFSGAADVDYPAKLELGAPLAEYSRVKVLFRLILAIPVLLIEYAMRIVAGIASFIAWFAIVITGKLPQGVYQMLHLGVGYQQRALPYFLLLTEDWPAFTQDTDRAALEPSPPTTSGTLTPTSRPESAPAEPGGFEPPSTTPPPPAPPAPPPPPPTG